MANPERLSAVAAHSAPHLPAAWARRTPSARRQDTPTLVWRLDAGPKCGMAVAYSRRQRAFVFKPTSCACRHKLSVTLR